MTTQPFQWWITPTPQQTKHIPQVGWEHPTKQPQSLGCTIFVGWEHPTIFSICSTVCSELSLNHNKSKDKSFRDCHTSMYQMVGCSHPTVELDRGIGSFRWWNASTVQQTKHVRVVGWEHPTTIEQQSTNNTKEPIIINDTKSVGWEHPTTKDRKWS